ncbi:LTA synthase family protein [Aestuariirhabdus litorea]|uniref:LTA synthase family protein n=1 Tax=Aestuariirhabdus litorea TaxID=2528527 RepID=A0A3P3VUG0_9GAMM|nr:LTA synthase family protein [Aestuariirhabdus litorea]RRJ85256.1 LTA synthase family protein [Aestuariirhabdus litorea]RWW98477.1 LTA synthase family protein [Endozoicomonadaceae bacterium GTF-13]
MIFNAITRIGRRGLLADLVVATFPLLMLTRALQVDANFGGMTDCRTCFAWAAIASDSGLFVLLLLLYGMLLVTPGRALQLLLKLLMLGLLLLYLVDLILLDMMAIRLNFSEALKYATAIGPTYDIVRGYIAEASPLLWISAALGVVLVVAFLLAPVTAGRWRWRALGLCGGLAALLWLFVPRVAYVHSWGYENVVQVNLSSGVMVAYSDPFIAELKERNESRDALACRDTPAPASRPNIVLVILESFSMHHSNFFSGLNDFTPQLDRIARENRAHTNFHANGFTTEAGLLALLTGRISLPIVEENNLGAGVSFQGGFNLEETLPKRLRSEGYYSAFLTSGDLGFLDKEAWLKSIGFDHTEGHQQRFYRNWPRFHFQAAPDRALYLRSQRVIEALEQRDRPFLAVIETVSTHLPFINPETGERSEAAALAYADRALGEFYDRMVRSGYFTRGGVMLIVSDHRTMTPISPGERERFGDRAESLVPLVVVDPERASKGIDTALGQQTDLVESLLGRVSGRLCPSFFGSDLFDPASSADCVFHGSGVVKERVSVLCSGAPAAVVRLNGDDTAFEGKAPARGQLILDYLNSERLRRLSGRYNLN